MFICPLVELDTASAITALGGRDWVESVAGATLSVWLGMTFCASAVITGFMRLLVDGDDCWLLAERVLKKI